MSDKSDRQFRNTTVATVRRMNWSGERMEMEELTESVR